MPSAITASNFGLIGDVGPKQGWKTWKGCTYRLEVRRKTEIRIILSVIKARRGSYIRVIGKRTRREILSKEFGGLERSKPMGEVPGAGRACQRLESGNVTDNKCCSDKLETACLTDGVPSGEDGNPIKAREAEGT